MKKLVRILGLFLLIFISVIQSCKKENPGVKKFNGPEFDLDSFDANLRESIIPSGTIGWSYVIVQNGLYAKGGVFGKARNNADGGTNLTINKKVNLASVSKWFTAIAAMQLLHARGMDEGNPIAPFLPVNWDKGPGVALLTFGDLLGHHSGLSSYNTDFSNTLSFSGLRRMIDTGVVRNKNNYDYQNANYALFRILIPSLWKGMDDAPDFVSLDSANTESVFRQYMQEHIFEPVGLTGIDCEDEARDKATLYYATSDGQSKSGVYYGSWTRWAGGGGLFMSAMDVARVLAYYRHTNVLLGKSTRDVMELNRFGYENKDDSREVHGDYFGKGGSIANDLKPPQGVLTEIVCFPNGVEVVVLCNSQGMTFAGNTGNLRVAIFDAYNKSWK